MATFDYSRTAASAAKLIKKFGQHGAIRRLVPGNGPPNDPGPPVPVDYPADFVITDYSAYEKQDSHIEVGDKKAIIGTVGLTIDQIKPQDKLVEANGRVWTVINSDPLQPDGATTVIISVQVRT